jgi:hypothetical protein
MHLIKYVWVLASVQNVYIGRRQEPGLLWRLLTVTSNVITSWWPYEVAVPEEYLGKRLSCAMLAVASMRVAWLQDLNLFEMPNLWACNSSEIEGWFGWSDKQATWMPAGFLTVTCCWFQVAHKLYGHELFCLLHTSHFYHMVFKLSLGPGSYLGVGFFQCDWLIALC